jgi:hypothetical protein
LRGFGSAAIPALLPLLGAALASGSSSTPRRYEGGNSSLW